ncbi:MAG: TIGR01777 family oxidoreductase [Bacteroidota bacterium]
MKIIITGGTGFIGTHLLHTLSKEEHSIVLLTRRASARKSVGRSDVRYLQWDPLVRGEWMKEVDGADVIINLIGKGVFEERWNARVKKQILESRIIPTQLMVEAVSAAKVRPSLMISASAVGFYGSRADEIITEDSSGGDDYLADVVRQWESAAYAAEQFGVRVATPRIGLVLEKSGGMIGKMLLPFQLFVGGPIGSGRQFLPWVHMDDVVRGILFPMQQSTFSGIYNLVSPHAVTMNEFSKTFGSVLHRPSWLPVPDFALSILYGEGAKTILSGQNAVPKKLISSGYQFTYSDLRTALQNILTK